MEETISGLAADARLRAGDGHLHFDITVRGSRDLGVELGADRAPDRRHRDARNVVLANLHLAAWQDPNRRLAYPRDRNVYRHLRRYFPGSASYAGTLWAIETLTSAGLIEHRKTRPGPNPRFRSTIRAADNLTDRSPIDDISQFVPTTFETIRLKDAEGGLRRYVETKQTRSWRRDIIAHNELLHATRISLSSPRWHSDVRGLLRCGNRVLNPLRNLYYRIFNRSCDLGGRLYGPWWQGLPARDRRLLKIDGQDVVELDYSSLHPVLLAAMAHHDLGEADPYEARGFPRIEAKLAFNILVNARSEVAAVLALQNELTSVWRPPVRDYALKLIDAVKARHPQFAGFWGTGAGLCLQFHDSEMCAVVQRQMRDAGCPVLSIHDSFIVQEPPKHRLQGVMDDALDRTKHRLARI